MLTVQDLLIKDFLENEEDNSNEMVQILDFTKNNGVPLTKQQVLGFLQLRENGLHDIADYAFSMKKQVTPVRFFFDMVSKITLADRIKGSAKLSHLMKATANPAGTLRPEEVQPKGMSKKEIGG